MEKNVSACSSGGSRPLIRSLEHVQVQLSLSYSRRGDLEISLTSPMGTRSMLVAIRYATVSRGAAGRVLPGLLQGRPLTLPAPPAGHRPLDISSQGYNNWIFMSTHYWDEDPQGLWTLSLENKGYYFNTGETWLRDYRLRG